MRFQSAGNKEGGDSDVSTDEGRGKGSSDSRWTHRVFDVWLTYRSNS